MVLIRLLAAALGLVAFANAAAQTPAQPRAPRDAPRPHAPSAGPRPLLFGFAVDCTRCRLAPGDLDPRPVWHYAELPRIAAVRPGGAAALAGVQEGDTIVLVDGLSILSSDGARRFSTVRPGERIHLTLHRGGRTVDDTLTLTRAPAPPPPMPVAGGQTSRYSGEVGGSAVDVWSATPVTVSVDSTGALVVQTGTSTVRVAPSVTPRPTSRAGSAPRP